MKTNVFNSKRILSLFLALVMVFSMMPMNIITASAAEKITYSTTNQAIEYQYYDSTSESWKTGTLEANAYNLVGTDEEWNADQNEGWYVAGSDIEISNRVSVVGDVKLVLTDGNTLNCAAGIKVPEGSSLTIYGQTAGTGTLKATGATYADSGIEIIKSTVTIDGGIVTATGHAYRDSGLSYSVSYCGSGIGVKFIENSPSSTETGGNLVIHGGYVNANGSDDGGYGRYAPGISVPITTGKKGNATVMASDISDMSNSASWSGIFFKGNTGAVYGEQTLTSDFSVESGYTFNIPSGSKLVVPEGYQLTNNGILNISGGELDCRSDLTNNGALNVGTDGTLDISGKLVNTNNVTINGTVKCQSIQNSQDITITGSLICGGGTNTGLIYNTGVLDNSGTISGENGYIISTTPVTGADSQLLYNENLFYRNKNGETVPIPADDAIYPITESDHSWKKHGEKTTWYVVTKDVTITNGVKLESDINLLLMDGVTLTVQGQNDNGGINAENYTINIYAQSNGTQMGKIVASGGHYNWMAIGGTNATVNIYGGLICAGLEGNSYSGIGAGIYRASRNITILGGLVKTKSIGNGTTIGSNTGGLYTPEGSNAIVYTNQTSVGNAVSTFHGILFLQTNGTVYGDQELAFDLTIEEGETLTIPEGTTWTIPQGVKLTVKGTLKVGGTIVNNGTIDNLGTVTIENNGKILINYGSTYSGEKPSNGKLSYQMDGCDLIVTGDTANYSWDKTNKVLTINGGSVTVSNKDKNTATSHRIYIQGTANVTLDGVNISTTTGAPIEIRDYNDTNVTLTLSGNNTLISQTANKAAIHKTRGQQATSSDAATLTINGSGSLTAVGGNNAAGIGGGGHRGDTHNIIINSGTISATGKGWAAGIGSSDDGSTWNIVVNGGNVTANGMPGIGANTDNWQGVKDASITGGMVTTNSYKGSTPTGGLVSTDGGNTFTVFSDYTLSRDLTIATDGKLTVAEGTKLIIADGFTLTNKGVIVNDGAISGNLVNEGTIYNKGTLPANVGGTVYEQYVKVNNGSGTGNYTEGSTVTITADAPASGKMFTGWTIELGTITLTDSAKAETTFTMPEGCVIVKANYADIVATITDSNGNVQYYSDGFRAQEDWTRNGGTLTVHSDDFRLEHMDAPDGSVLDLNGHSVEPMMLHIRNSCTIQNGTISMWHEGIVEEDAVVTFKNVTITNDEHGSWEVEITNDGTIIDEGLTLNGVIISGGSVKTGLTEDRVTLSGLPTEGYVYDGTAHEPGVKCGETTLVAGTDYTVTFSNSSGGDSTVNAGTITMTITGIGNYAGTVTKTYTITDTTAPTGTILIKENSWREFWNWISFGLFCKDHVDVTITADGTGSNATKVEYLLSNTVMEENNIPNDGWTALTKDGNAYKFRIQPKSKVAVYVRITDEGGNVTIINSDGIVVYEDSKAIDTELTYTYKENSNKDIAVEFNGNTVKSITCGEKVLAANTDYSVDYESGKIVLKSTYLDTLNAGDYTFTVSYNPMGFENSGVTDLTTTFTVKVDPTSITGATVTVNGTFTYDGNAKTPDPVVVLNGETLVKDRDYTVSYAENLKAGTATVTVTGKGNYNDMASGEYEITKREITITVDAKNTVVNTTLPTYTYKVEGLVGGDALVTEPTLTCNANIAVIGEYDITASGADAGGNYSIKYVPAKLTVLTDNVVDVAAGYTEELKDYDPATVTSQDKDELQDMLDEINTILGDETITTNGKNAMEEVKKQVKDLIKEITDAAEATYTENTKKVEDVTAENVTPDNKTDLEKSKADLEKALDEHGNNMTEDEKKAIEDEIKRIYDALEVIGNVEEIEETISKLPAVDTVKPDDEEAIKAITDAQTAYNALSEYEKSLVDEATKASLDKLVAALVAYDIVEGDGSSWTEDSDHNITFVVNGLFSKFVGIKVDGKVVDKANYETKAGSTIITLKASYLDTLKAGEHTITVLYTDGETEGTFNVHAKTNSPATGDNSNIFLWIALLFVSGTGIFGITLYDRKRKTANK